MRKRSKRKEVIKHINDLSKEVYDLQRQSNAIVEMLKASGVIEALGEGEDMVTIRRNVLGMSIDTHYKVNEVF